MGTSSIQKSMSETKKIVLSDFCYDTEKIKSIVISSKNGKGGMWVLRKILDKIDCKEFFYIDFVKMETKDGFTYWKEIGYDMGPNYYDCPLNWLDKVEYNSEWATNWKKKVLFFSSFQIVPNIEFDFFGTMYRIIQEHSTKFWLVRKIADNKLYKLSKDNISESILRAESKEM